MRNTIIYTVTFAAFIIGLWKLAKMGETLPVKPSQTQIQKTLSGNSQQQSVPITSLGKAKEQFVENIKHPLSLLLLQILVIILVSRAVSFVLTMLGQQSVIGEIISGLVLGPSVMGLLFPNFFHFIFPAESLGTLQFLSMIGLSFFMFIIGMDLDIDQIKKNASDAALVSYASIILPFLLGVWLAYTLYQNYAPVGTGFIPFAMFTGISVSITAFPVLARILQERKMTKTPMGSLAILCAATNDVIAWCILAAVIAIAKAGDISSAFFTIALAALFIFIMIYVVRPLIQKFAAERLKKESPDRALVALAFFSLLGSAYVAEIIGIHALFGSFLAGVIMPHNNVFRKQISEKIEDVSVMVLLPIFFAFTGLRTQMGLLNDGSAWRAFGLVLLVATSGKVLGSALSAKIVGQSWRNASSIGILMNTRGLMELIVLNIGYDLGVFSPQIFAMMVLMALVTTFMTGPLLNLVDWLNKKKLGGADAALV